MNTVSKKNVVSMIFSCKHFSKKKEKKLLYLNKQILKKSSLKKYRD